MTTQDETVTTIEATTQITVPEPIVSSGYPVVIGHGSFGSYKQLKNYYLADGFYEDRAWVYYLDSNEEINLGLINEEGALIWNQKAEDHFKTLPIKSGVTVISNHESGKMLLTDKSGFSIMDIICRTMIVEVSQQTKEAVHIGQLPPIFLYLN